MDKKGCSRDAVFRFVDAFFLATVFLFQSVILNYFIIFHFNKSSLPFLWFLGDFFCLLIFSWTLFLAYRRHHKLKQREKQQSSLTNSNSYVSYRTNSRSGSDEDRKGFVGCFNEVSKLPFSYISWISYSIILIAKLVVLFKADIPQNLNKDDFFGPNLLKIGIGVSAIVFSLLVEAHQDAQNDPVRNAYVNSTAYGIALEILDTTTFLSLLIESETHLMYTYNFENYIIALASINLMLPAIALYKLTVSNFGRTYPVSLETLYKVLHLFLVNGAYFGVRVYLWRKYTTDTSIFMVKNVYSIVSFCRGIYPDMKLILSQWHRRVNVNHILPLGIFGTSRMNGKAKSCSDIGSGEEIPMEKSASKRSIHIDSLGAI